MKKAYKPRLETLEARRVMASVILGESTFDPQAFGRNISEGLDFNIVGYAYAINHNGNAVVAEGTGGLYGPNDGRARTSVAADAPETVFETDTRIEINSVTKIITAVAVLHLLESRGGDLDTALSTPISEFLPSHWTIGPNVEFITIRHLLTHTSGFYEGGPSDRANAIGVNFQLFGNNNLQNLRDLIAANPGIPDINLPNGSPAYSRGYSNANFSILAKMIPYMLAEDGGAELDDISLNSPDSADLHFGSAYVDYVRDHILSPAGIIDASAAPTGDNPALGYVLETAETVAGRAQRDLTSFAGAFGLKLNAPELARFLNTIRHTNILLSDTARSLMNNEDFLLGWAPNSASGSNPVVLSPLKDAFGTYFEHGGAGPGFRSQVVMMPGNVEVALAMGGFPPSIPDRFAFLRTAYANAWSGLVIEGDDDSDDFVVRRNPEQPTRIDIVAIEGGNEVIIASPSGDLLTALEFRGLGGNDRFFIQDLPANVNLILNGGADDDTFEIGNPIGNSAFDHVFGSMTVMGGDGNDSLQVLDSNGIGEGYSITGVVNPELVVDGIVDATNYTDGKLFLYHSIEELRLEANTDPNQIDIIGITAGMSVIVFGGANDDRFSVSDISSDVRLTLYGEGGADTFDIGSVAVNTIVLVLGDPANLPGSDDVLQLGRGNLGTVQGRISFRGFDGHDSVYLDDSGAPVGRRFDIEEDGIKATGGFGELALIGPQEYIQIDAGSKDDEFFLDSLNEISDIELFGHGGSDSFFITNEAQNVDPVAGLVVIHGGDGYDTRNDPIQPEFKDDDQIYVRDDSNSIAGIFVLDHGVDNLHGHLTKSGLTQNDALLNVVYDQVERTELHTDDGDNDIFINAAPMFNQVTVYAGDGADQISIENTPISASAMRIFGEAGADDVRVIPTAQDLGNLRSPLTIDGGDGLGTVRDSLSIYDSLSGNIHPYVLDDDNLSRNGSAGVTYVRIENLLLSLSAANNQIHVDASAPGTSTVIRGNAGNDILFAQNLRSAVNFEGGIGRDTAVFLGTAEDDNFTNVGNRITLGTGSLTTSVESREIDGRRGLNQLTLEGVVGKADKFQVHPSTLINSGRVSLAPSTAIVYNNVHGIEVKGNLSESDSLQFNGQTSIGIAITTHVDHFAINLQAAGTYDDPILVLSNLQGQTLLKLTDYEGVGRPKINSLAGADTFELTTSVTRPQVILDGGAGSDVLAVQNSANSYVITGSNAGFVGETGFVTAFRSIENIAGTAGDDQVSFRTGGSLSGTVDGGLGANSLDYSKRVGDTVVNLLLGSATAVTLGVSNFQSVVGSKGNNVLVGDANPNTLIGGTGRNLLIGGAGADEVRGGGGNNIIIGGTTKWDNNSSALQAIMQEFLQTYVALTPVTEFNIRVNNIRLGKGTLVDTAWYLDKQKRNAPATVFSDAAVDQLFGGKDLNWFITDAFDVINDGQGIKLNDRLTEL